MTCGASIHVAPGCRTQCRLGLGHDGDHMPANPGVYVEGPWSSTQDPVERFADAHRSPPKPREAPLPNRPSLTELQSLLTSALSRLQEAERAFIEAARNWETERARGG